ncbi:MAG: hypothetical protein ABJN26_15590 [Stappiaceae bacterium]
MALVMRHTGGQNVFGATMGVLCLESYFPKPPGHVRNHSSLPFPALYETVVGVMVPKLLDNSTPDLLQPFIEAARHLKAEGARQLREVAVCWR